MTEKELIFKNFLKENLDGEDINMVDYEKIEDINRLSPSLWFWHVLKFNCNKAAFVENKWQKELLKLKGKI